MNWETDVEFCPNMDGQLKVDEMASFLAKEVFDDEGFVEILMARYEQIKKLAARTSYDDDRWSLQKFGCYNVTQGAHDARLKVSRSKITSKKSSVSRLFDYDNFGHDMPIWIGSLRVKKDAKRVMIISQDPRRTGDTSGNVYLSTPFGLHCHDWANGNSYVKNLVEKLIGAGVCVYLTDYAKFFAASEARIWNSIRAKRRADEFGYKELFGAALKSEFKIVDPSLIIMLGDDWRVFSPLCSAEGTNCRGIQKDVEVPQVGKVSVISAYHPNRARWETNSIREWLGPVEHPVNEYYSRIAQSAIEHMK